MNKPNYNILTPFKRWTIQNFPFIEEDFDAITNYQLLCKIVEYLNKVIENEKELENVNNELIDAFNNLKSYVDNYFDNLDIQSEVNNKLDDMAESGQLTDIIAQYLGLAGVLAFNTINDMSDGENLTNGSICYCLGDEEYNDGKGGFYKVRTVTVDDTVDGFNIVALDVSNTLIAERMPNYYINQLNTQITDINNNLNLFYEKSLLKNKRFVMIGDSYVTGTLNGVQFATDGWAKRIKDNLGLTNDNCFIYGEGGSGFTATGHQGNDFEHLLSNNLSNITDKNSINYIVVCGGYNDRGSTIATIETKINAFITLAKTNFPNAKIYVGCISTTSGENQASRTQRREINHTSLVAYKNCTKYGAFYLNGCESILKDYSLMGTDYFHPSINGYNALAYNLVQILETGNFYLTTDIENPTITALDGKEISTNELNIISKVTDNNLLIILKGYMVFVNDIPFNTSDEIPLFKINSSYIRTNFGNDLQLSGQITVGSAGYLVDGYLFINDNNELVIKFQSYPEGITAGKRINIRTYDIFNIND